MSALLSQCLNHPSAQAGCRRALLNNATILTGSSFAIRPSAPGDSQRQVHSSRGQNKGKKSQNNGRGRTEFKRDELPHAGRAPVPEGTRRIEPDRRPFESSRHSEPDRRPFESSRRSESGRRPFESSRGGDPGRRPFESSRGPEPSRRPFDSGRRPEPDRRPFDGSRRNESARRPFDSGRRSTEPDRRSFDGNRRPESGRRPFDSNRRTDHDGPPSAGGMSSFQIRNRRGGPPPRGNAQPSDTGTPKYSQTVRKWSAVGDAVVKARLEAKERSRAERLPGSEPPRGGRRYSQYPSSSHANAEFHRSEPPLVGGRIPPYLSLSQSDVALNTDTPTTFGSGLREDRELEEGAYDAPETADEFFHPPEPVTLASSTPIKGKGRSKSPFDADPLSSHSACASFTSPPLLPGFVSALQEIFGPNAQPTPIQSLSIAHCLPAKPVDGAPGWKQFLLASETGSGKSIAYLLPLLQGVKSAELAEQAAGGPEVEVGVPGHMQRALNPRGLVLAPTHELARQLAGFAKALLHDVKLRVLCASRANDKSTTKRTDASAAQMAAVYATEATNAEGGAVDGRRQAHPVGVVVGTPMKLLEMVRGRGWDRIEEEEAARAREEEDEDDVDEEGRPRVKPRRGRDKMVHYGTWRAKPELGLANVEWVVVDEADVLFDPDFQETTRTLLADISAARGHVLPPSASIPVPPTLGQPSSPTTLSNPLPAPTTSSSAAASASTSSNTPIDYPFNLILTSATIPKSLNGYLSTYHPSLVRLASPQLHRLPRTLQTEYVGWTGGNKFADVARRIKRVWAEDAASGHAHAQGAAKGGELSKVLVFCNRSAKVEEFAEYLEGQGVKSVALTSRSEARGRGSNRHLDGFLRTRASSSPLRPVTSLTPTTAATTPADPKAHPHVLITTSLLSRGLDFAPDIRHVFIVDEPRNTVDFLHRAGRTGRAGQWGKVVIFGKLKGRGSQRTKEVRKRIQGLRS